MIARNRHKKLFGNSPTGFTLVEVLLAIFVIAVVLVGVFAVVYQTVSGSSDVERRTVAIQLAQEGIEIVHAIQKSNFIHGYYGGGSTFGSNGLSSASCASPTGCEIQCKDAGSFPQCAPLASDEIEVELVAFSDSFLGFDSSTAQYGVGLGSEQSIFKRKITVDDTSVCPSSECVAINVEITWQERGEQRSVEAETRIYNWVSI